MTRGIPALATLVLMLNGMAPYLGFRFNYSFAMWSNLRADQHRWNSWIVPPQVQVWPVSEQFIDVRSARAVALTMPIFPGTPVRARQFVEAVAPLVGRPGVQWRIEIEWAGARETLASPDDAPRLTALLAAMGDAPADTNVVVQQADVTMDPPLPAPAPEDRSPYETRLEPALFSPTGFRRALQATARRRQNFALEFAWEGRVQQVSSTLTDSAFGRFVDGLPESNRFPPKLARAGSQRCFH